MRRGLERIPGVAAARVALENGGGTLRHALLALEPGTPDDEVRVVAAAVLAGLGVAGEASRIDTAHLGSAAPGPRSELRGAPLTHPLPPRRPQAPQAPGVGGWGAPRTLLRHDIHLRREEGQITCRVELMHQGAVLAGEAADLDTPPGRARAAARATLKAVEGIRAGMRLELEGVHFGEFFGRRHLVLSVEAVHGRSHAILTGIVLATASAEESGCLATLRAVERWLTR
ncbi:MAG TPA: hypothetical protein VMK65_05105 [Longimicrobiales bacterium]|nr:hypothetical protein [Longimicrobiales bacterium]